ncbi:hypothetical protein ACS0TY_036414 [Phlomoides rotata]
MTAAKGSDAPSSHQSLLSESQFHHPQPPQYIVVAPPYLHPYRSRRRRDSSWCRFICIASTLLLLSAATYLLWPSDPEHSVARLKLDHLHFHTSPKFSLDVTLDLLNSTQR